MRNLLWRGLSVALAGCIGWLLWHWPVPAKPVEFALDADSLQSMPQVLPAECLLHGKLAQVTVQTDGSILLVTEQKSGSARLDLEVTMKQVAIDTSPRAFTSLLEVLSRYSSTG